MRLTSKRNNDEDFKSVKYQYSNKNTRLNEQENYILAQSWRILNIHLIHKEAKHLGQEGLLAAQVNPPLLNVGGYEKIKYLKFNEIETKSN